MGGKLYKNYNIGSILIEGGSSTLGSFYSSNIINKANVFISPKFLGDGNNATSPFNTNLLINKISQSKKLFDINVSIIDNDIYISGYTSNIINKIYKKLINCPGFWISIINNYFYNKIGYYCWNHTNYYTADCKCK